MAGPPFMHACRTHSLWFHDGTFDFGVQMKRYIVIVLALFMSTPFVGAVAALSNAAAQSIEPGEGQLRIMTINVWSGLDYKGTLSMGEYEPPEVREARFQALVQEIRSLSPDIIGINEANFLPDYVERLTHTLGYDSIYHVGISGFHVWRIGIPWNLKEGDAILARKNLGLEYVGRKQLSGGGLVWNNLSFHTENATQVLVGKIRRNKKDLYIAVTHWHASPRNDERNRGLLRRLKEEFGYSEEEYKKARSNLEVDNSRRINEAKAMASYLEKIVPEGVPLAAIGDFNAELDWPEMQYLLSAGFYDTYSVIAKDEGYTWNVEENENIKSFYQTDLQRKFEDLYEHLNSHDRLRSKRIDFILAGEDIPKGLVLESKVCARTRYRGVHPSDHFGVFTVIQIP
jgi:endonuclease/exonuclease/phosphatase family metal-dependent hydrolase